MSHLRNAQSVKFRVEGFKLRVEHHELGWKAASDEKSMTGFIYSNRKISKGEPGAPGCDNFASVAIDHCNVTSIGSPHLIMHSPFSDLGTLREKLRKHGREI